MSGGFREPKPTSDKTLNAEDGEEIGEKDKTTEGDNSTPEPEPDLAPQVC